MNRRITEQDEFLLSRLVDNDLPPEEADVLRARLAGEPELQRVYARLTRLDTLLIARSADQPQIDWQQFHRQVMAQVTNESPAAVSSIYKFRNYLKIVLPLAAAAAIALVVWMQPHGAVDNHPRPGTGSGIVADSGGHSTPGTVQHADSATLLVVRYDRHESPAAGSGIEVRYGRSDELQKEYEELDDHNRSQESYGAILATMHDQPKPAIPKAVVVAAASLVF